MMSSLTQELILGLIEQLKYGDAVGKLLRETQAPLRTATSRANSVSSNLASSDTTPIFNGDRINLANVAGSSNSNAAVWSNAAH